MTSLRIVIFYVSFDKKQQAASPDAACVLTVERSLMPHVHLAVSTVLSNSWRFIRQKLYFHPACGAFNPLNR